MASRKPKTETPEASSKPSQWLEAMMSIQLMETNQPSTVSFGNNRQPLETSQGYFPENSTIIREALRMNLPRHLVLRNAQRRLQTTGSNYTDLKDLVADLFERDGVPLPPDQEVPMVTNQLEEAMRMMNSLVVKKAVELGVPLHLIKAHLHAKIITSGAPYNNVHELLADVNKN